MTTALRRVLLAAPRDVREVLVRRAAARALLAGVACGGARRRRRDLGRSAARQPGDRLAAAGHPGRLAGDADQLPRRARARRCPTCTSSARSSGVARRARCAPTRPAPARASCRAHPFRAGERVTVHAHVGTGGATQPASTTFTIAHQAAVSQKEFPINPGDPQRGPALQLGAVADALDGAHHDARQARRGARRSVPRALPGPGLARADDRRSERQPRVVSPARRRAVGDELPGSAVPGQAGADVVAGTDHPGRLRRGRRRDLRQLLPPRRRRSGPATATAPTCTRSG